MRAFIGSAPQLADFIRSDRFRKKPPKLTVTAALNRGYEDPKRMKSAARLPTRQIANGMAGVPRLDWRTSLDRCSANPSRMLVGKRTEEYYREVYGIPGPQKLARLRKPCRNPAETVLVHTSTECGGEAAWFGGSRGEPARAR